MSGFERIASIVREARKSTYPSIKDAAPLLGIGEHKLWEIENAKGMITPEIAQQLGRSLDLRIPRIYCSEICPNRDECRRPIEPDRLAESVLTFQQEYKEIRDVVFETLPNVAADGKVTTDEISKTLNALERLTDLIFKADSLKLRIEMEIGRDRSAVMIAG